MSKKRKLAYEVPGSNTDDGKNKQLGLLILFVSLFLLFAILLSVFLYSYLSVVHLTSDEDGSNVIDRKKGIVYELAPMCYVPTGLYKKDVYARYNGVDFHKIGITLGGEFIAADPTLYIGTVTDGNFDIYYNSEHPMPSFTEFQPKYALVCMSGTITSQVGTLEGESAEKIINLFANGERTSYPISIKSDSLLELYFISEDYRFFYYVIAYFKTENGDGYLYDRSNNICVNIGDTPLNFE